MSIHPATLHQAVTDKATMQSPCEDYGFLVSGEPDDAGARVIEPAALVVLTSLLGLVMWGAIIWYALSLF